jgi:DDB1- and CUL4-associated factor 10
MQVRRQYIPVVSKYDHLFSKNQKRNRVELISDFPKGNDAEVISSLQVMNT